MKKACFLAVLCLGVLWGMPALAADLTAEGLFVSETNCLEVQGVTESQAAGQITAVIIPYTKDAEALSVQDVEQQEAVFNMVPLDETGKFEIVMGLPSQWEGGLYKAVINQGGAACEVWFTYLPADRAQEELARLNAADAAGIAAVLTEAGKTLGAEPEQISRYGQTIGRYLYENRPNAGYTLDGYLKEYTAALAFCQIQSGGEPLHEVAVRFSAYLDIDIQADYLAYPAAVQQEIGRLLKQTVLGGTPIAELYQQCLLLARVNKAESNLALQSLVLENSETLGVNLSAYHALPGDYERLRVFTLMLGKSHTSYGQVADAFSEACRAAAADEDNNRRPGGSSPGGGTGGGIGGAGTIINKPESTAVPQASAQPDISNGSVFTDMAGHWASAAVAALANKDVINGFPDGSFLPEQTVTRAEFSKMLCLVLQLQKSDWQSAFSDVAAQDWFAPYVLSLADAGVITGYEGSFLPEEYITRQDAAVMTWRALQEKGVSLSGSPAFLDAAQIAGYAQEAVGALAAAGILNGYEDGCFLPLGETTRAEAATILYHVAEAYGQE